jgi:SulP family sulfate permease
LQAVIVDGDQTHVVETILKGTMVGELEMFASRPRTCKLIVEQDAILWKMEKSVWNRACIDTPLEMVYFMKLAVSYDVTRYYNSSTHWSQLRD